MVPGTVGWEHGEVMASRSIPAIRRPTGDGRMISGVAAGIARGLGVDVVLVRVAFVLLSFAGGVGIVLYAALTLVVPQGEQAPAARRSGGRTVEQAVGVGLITVGLMLLLRRVGLLLPDEVVWPAAVMVVGVAIAWTRLDGRTTDLLDGGRGLVIRLVAGALLLAVGIGVFVALNERLVVATQVVIAVTVTTAGVGLLAGPWIVRLGRQLTDERAQRIRADERAEVAAHLHDSVLQTLAMIQRRASSPAETVALARRQERELRDWLHGGGRAPRATTFAGAVQALADEVEADHLVAIEVVVVGDTPLTEDLRAAVAAAREATVNAARHSGSEVVSVYAEVDDDDVTTFVRDRGVGFDPDSLSADRRGVSESIVGRMDRHGGRADIQSAPGEGTEITLTMPISDASADATRESA